MLLDNLKNLNFVNPNSFENFNFQMRNINLARNAVLSLIEKKFDMTKFSNLKTLGRGNKLEWNGINIQFYNSHNIDGHRELFNSAAFSNNRVVVLFFSKRPNDEVIKIYRLYKMRLKNKMILGCIRGHHKVLDKKSLPESIQGKEIIIDFSNFTDSIKILKRYGEEFIFTGTNYIQSVFYENQKC